MSALRYAFHYPSAASGTEGEENQCQEIIKGPLSQQSGASTCRAQPGTSSTGGTSVGLMSSGKSQDRLPLRETALGAEG